MLAQRIILPWLNYRTHFFLFFVLLFIFIIILRNIINTSKITVNDSPSFFFDSPVQIYLIFGLAFLAWCILETSKELVYLIWATKILGWNPIFYYLKFDISSSLMSPMQNCFHIVFIFLLPSMVFRQLCCGDAVNSEYSCFQNYKQFK